MTKETGPHSSAQTPSMRLVLRLRLPAILCSLVFVLCVLASRPYVEMGINDDWSYARTAQLLAQTGHISYNGWATAMLGWQLYVAALFIKLFGFSFTVVRFSMLPVTMAAAFLLQRTFVRAGLIEWNATLATLTLVLSPLYLPLAVTYMTDVPGLFVLVVCLYACLRTVQAATPRATIAWICFATISNAIGGTVRQVAWLGLLVMVPCTLWLVRRRPRVLVFAVPVLLASVAFIVGAIHWFQQQPYSWPELLVSRHFGSPELRQLIRQMVGVAIELPLFLLPVLLAFTSALHHRVRRDTMAIAVGCFLAMFVAVIYVANWQHAPGLEPVLPNYVSLRGLADTFGILGPRPTVLQTNVRVFLTVLVFIGVFGFLTILLTGKGRPVSPANRRGKVSWHDLAVMLVPFSLAYLALLTPRTSYDAVYDRYLLELMVVALIFAVRYYQEQIQSRLPGSSLVLILLIAAYSIAGTHDVFAMYRGRLAAVNELRSAGLPDTSIDGGFEFDAWTQIERAGAVNSPGVRTPAGVYVPMPIHAPLDKCHPFWDDYLPQINALYALSFDPNLCQGDAGFPPVVYRTWLPPHQTEIYIVGYATHQDRRP
jgi:hypothetical protein